MPFGVVKRQPVPAPRRFAGIGGYVPTPKRLLLEIIALPDSACPGDRKHCSDVVKPPRFHRHCPHQTLSFDADNKFIEDVLLGGRRLDPNTVGRPDARPNVRENASQLASSFSDFDPSTGGADAAPDPVIGWLADGNGKALEAGEGQRRHSDRRQVFVPKCGQADAATPVSLIWLPSGQASVVEGAAMSISFNLWT